MIHILTLFTVHGSRFTYIHTSKTFLVISHLFIGIKFMIDISISLIRGNPKGICITHVIHACGECVRADFLHTKSKGMLLHQNIFFIFWGEGWGALATHN